MWGKRVLDVIGYLRVEGRAKELGDVVACDALLCEAFVADVIVAFSTANKPVWVNV